MTQAGEKEEGQMDGTGPKGTGEMAGMLARLAEVAGEGGYSITAIRLRSRKRVAGCIVEVAFPAPSDREA